MKTNKKLRRFYEILEGTTKEVFKKKSEFEDNDAKSKNDYPKIFMPKKVRQLMISKSKLSKRILSSTKWWKNLEMEDELEV